MLPVVLAAILVGYRYSSQPTRASRAGIWTGFAASIANVLVVGANTLTTISDPSASWTVVAVVATTTAIGLVTAITVAVTTVVAAVTDSVSNWVDEAPARRRGSPER